MPCLHCRQYPWPAGATDHQYPTQRTMGASGPRLAPDGFSDGLICGGCGVLFFTPPTIDDLGPQPSGIAAHTLERWHDEAQSVRRGELDGMPAAELARCMLQLIDEVKRLDALRALSERLNRFKAISRNRAQLNAKEVAILGVEGWRSEVWEITRPAHRSLLAPDDPPLSDTQLETLRLQAQQGSTFSPYEARRLLDEIDIDRARLDAQADELVTLHKRIEAMRFRENDRKACGNCGTCSTCGNEQ